MKQEIKERIEQINSGSVPDNFKKVGRYIIPNNWTLTKMSKCVFQSGKKNKKNLDLESYSISNMNGFIPQEELFENSNYKNADKSMYIIVDPHSFAYNPARIDVGSIGYQNLSNDVIVSSLYEVFKTTDICDDKFLWYWFHSKHFNNMVTKYQEGGVRQYYYFDKLCCSEICLPPIEEQEKISEILETQDKTIKLQEKIIEEKIKKKEYIKNQLLLGEKRVKGFTGAWNKTELCNIYDYIQPTKYLVENTFYNDEWKTPVLTAGKSFILGYTNETFGIYDEGPVVLFDDFTTSSQYVDFPFKVKSSAIKILKCKEQYNDKFCFEVMQSIKFKVANHERHWISKYSVIPVSIPELDEQNAIMDILSHFNKEIDLLKELLEQEKQKKKALMQLLLTGIVRV